MKLRIAIWAAAGAFVVVLQFIYFMTTHASLHGLMLTLVCISCPIALTRQHPMSVYFVLLTNAATYAVVGALIETILRHFRNTDSIAH